MDKKTLLIAQVRAEIKASLAIGKFEKEFEHANQPIRQTGKDQANNNPTGNAPQQPQYVG